MPAEPIGDVEAFYLFLGQQLHVGAASKSPEQMLDDWRRKREHDETIAAVEEGVRDMQAGRMRPLRELQTERSSRARADQ